MSAEAIIDAILVREGGFVNDPADHGGATKFGITQSVLADVRMHPVSVDDMKALSLNEARSIYMDRYFHHPSYHLLGSESLQEVMVDFAVNSGTVTATKALQRCLNVTDDGILGAETLHAANLKDGARLGVKVLCERQRLIAAIVHDHPDQARFLKGWTDRVMDQIEARS